MWGVHTNVCSCSANVILCRGQKRMSMSCFITLHLVPLRYDLSLNLELSWLPARLSDSPVSNPYPVHKTDGIPPGFFCGCGGLLLRSYACSASTLTHCATSQLRLIIKLTIICREKNRYLELPQLIGYIFGSTRLLKLDDQTCNSPALYSSKCVF